MPVRAFFFNFVFLWKFLLFPRIFCKWGGFLSNFACLEISGVGSHGPVTAVLCQNLCFFELSGVGPHWPARAFGVEFSFFEYSACAAHFCQMARLFVKFCVFLKNSRFPAYFVKWGWSSRLPVKAFCVKSRRFFDKFLCFLISAIGRSGRCFVKFCVFL